MPPKKDNALLAAMLDENPEARVDEILEDLCLGAESHFTVEESEPGLWHMRLTVGGSRTAPEFTYVGQWRSDEQRRQVFTCVLAAMARRGWDRR